MLALTETYERSETHVEIAKRSSHRLGSQVSGLSRAPVSILPAASCRPRSLPGCVVGHLSGKIFGKPGIVAQDCGCVAIDRRHHLRHDDPTCITWPKKHEFASERCTAHERNVGIDRRREGCARLLDELGSQLDRSCRGPWLTALTQGSCVRGGPQPRCPRLRCYARNRGARLHYRHHAAHVWPWLRQKSPRLPTRHAVRAKTAIWSGRNFAHLTR